MQAFSFISLLREAEAQREMLVSVLVQGVVRTYRGLTVVRTANSYRNWVRGIAFRMPPDGTPLRDPSVA